MAAKIINAKREIRHRSDCIALKQVKLGIWDTPWYNTGKSAYRDKRGGLTGMTTQWLVFGCNCTLNKPCDAILLVRESAIIDMFSSVPEPKITNLEIIKEIIE